MKNLSNNQISDKIWSLLQEFNNPKFYANSPSPLILYINPQNQQLSYLTDTDAYETNNDLAKALINKWVSESINKMGKVILYYCKDNALISIEQDSDGLEFSEEQAPNFYIDFD